MDRLIYCPKKHKDKKRREMRQQLQAKVQTSPTPSTSDNKYTMKFGSFNVNGLDIEARWAVEELLNTRGFDVSNFNPDGP